MPYSDIDPSDIDPDTGRPYPNYNSPALDNSFQEGEGWDDDDDYPAACTDPDGHEWPMVEEHERCLCIHCGADGDA